jgi:hypothetical protein
VTETDNFILDWLSSLPASRRGELCAQLLRDLGSAGQGGELRRGGVASDNPVAAPTDRTKAAVASLLRRCADDLGLTPAELCGLLDQPGRQGREALARAAMERLDQAP